MYNENIEKPGQVSRETQIPNQLGNLEKQISSLHNVIDRLALRLQRVSREIPMIEPGMEKETAEQNLVPIADQIRSYGNSIKGAINKLQELESYLEI